MKIYHEICFIKRKVIVVEQNYGHTLYSETLKVIDIYN